MNHTAQPADPYAGPHDTPEGVFWIARLRHPKGPGWYWAASSTQWYGPYRTSRAAYQAALHALTPDFE